MLRTGEIRVCFLSMGPEIRILTASLPTLTLMECF